MHKSLLLAITALPFLAACGGSTQSMPSDDGPVVSDDAIVENANGTLTVTLEDTTLEIPAPIAPSAGVEPILRDTDLLGDIDQTDDYIAVAGVSDGTPFAAVSGNVSAPPAGDATFDGRAEVVSGGASERFDMSFNFDLASGALTGVNGRIRLNAATDTAGVLTGNMTFDDVDGDFSGGFFNDANEFAGGFTGPDFAGLLYGEQGP